MPSEIQTSVAGGFSDRGDATVVGVATAIEHDSGDTGGLGALGDQCAHALGGCHAAAAAGGAQVGLSGRSCSQGVAAVVVDHLDRDVLVRAIDSEARTLGGAVHLLAHPTMAGDATLTAGLGDVSHDVLPITSCRPCRPCAGCALRRT